MPFNERLLGEAASKQQRVFGQLVSPDCLQVMGVEAGLERVLSPAIGRAGDAPTAMISDHSAAVCHRE